MQRPFPARSNGETLLLRMQQQNHSDAFSWAASQRMEYVLDLRIVAVEREYIQSSRLPVCVLLCSDTQP